MVPSFSEDRFQVHLVALDLGYESEEGLHRALIAA